MSFDVETKQKCQQQQTNNKYGKNGTHAQKAHNNSNGNGGVLDFCSLLVLQVNSHVDNNCTQCVRIIDAVYRYECNCRSAIGRRMAEQFWFARSRHAVTSTTKLNKRDNPLRWPPGFNCRDKRGESTSCEQSLSLCYNYKTTKPNTQKNI